ncbi:MAG: hypothetical protein FP814_04365 [Desulfobacterium sp.]|nr:hypothetical protein [Desulfobacterium sp.]MBU3948235.1 hypothetical protein [Pseudomonadota bacterium]MBU4009720.1 hypothetical protein [Pseudomonadota bacterium]MBU4037809.1 hypothetical protein [Pseudomonadota bacterium]
METTVKNTLDNENGMIMVVVLIILVIVTILGLSASQTSVTEVQIATNERRLVSEFFNAEGGLIDTLERSPTWLDDAFLASETAPGGETAVNFVNPNVDFNADGIVDARVEVRCIESTGGAVPGLTAAANNVPVAAHITAPPEGSGNSLKNFVVRRYAVTVTSATGNTQTQAGVWKTFNKF